MSKPSFKTGSPYTSLYFLFNSKTWFHDEVKPTYFSGKSVHVRPGLVEQNTVQHWHLGQDLPLTCFCVQVPAHLFRSYITCQVTPWLENIVKPDELTDDYTLPKFKITMHLNTMVMTQLSSLSYVLMYGSYGSVTLYIYNRIPYNERGGTWYRKSANDNMHCYFNFS